MEQDRQCGLANAHQRVEEYVCRFVREKGENAYLRAPLNSKLLKSACVCVCVLLLHPGSLLCSGRLKCMFSSSL